MARKERHTGRREAPAPETPAYPWRSIAAVVLAIAGAAFGAMAMLLEAGTLAPADRVSANEDRFMELHRALPARGTAGYISDIGQGDYSKNGSYFMAQYALAPVLLEPGLNHDLIVGNFSSPAAVEAGVSANRLVVVRDFGNGVLLLRKATP